MRLPLSAIQLFLTVVRDPTFPFHGCLGYDEIILFRELEREIRHEPLFDPRPILAMECLGASSYRIRKSSFDPRRCWTQDDPLVRLYEARRVFLAEYFADDVRVDSSL